jgi:hypothetical protein
MTPGASATATAIPVAVARAGPAARRVAAGALRRGPGARP